MRAKSAAANAGSEQQKSGLRRFFGFHGLRLRPGAARRRAGCTRAFFYRPAPGAARRPRSSSPTAMTSAYSARYQATATPCATTAA